MSETEVELVLDAKASLGEGPIWHAAQQRLYWVDILGHAVHVFDPATRRDRSIDVGQPVGTVVSRRSGGLMLALQDGFASLELETGAVHIIVDPEAHLPANRFNDGKCDPAGRFWAGTMPLKEDARGTGSLYCLDRDLSVRKMLGNVSCSNGIAWSLDSKTMYYIDSPTRAVSAFDYDLATGNIANRREIIRTPPEEGFPDGMTIDAEGMLWVAYWGGSRVVRWDPRTGKRLAIIAVPVSCVTACWFGGPRLDELYITSARTGLDAATLAMQPYAGSLLRVRPGICGIEAFEFAG